MAEYIEREAAIQAASIWNGDESTEAWIKSALKKLPAADVRHVIVCAKCRHNNHCFTQAFVDDCGKIPLDRNTFFCADGEDGE